MRVEPIRSKEKIKLMYQLLRRRDVRYSVLFKFGINTGLRVGDIIKLRVCDIYTPELNFKEHLVLVEQKTKKNKMILLNRTVRTCLAQYVHTKKLPYEGYLFYSRKGGYLGRVQVYRVLRAAATTLGIEHFGTHSMRKTWGYWTYKLSKYNIGLIMDTLNHSSPAITLRYIGINQDEKDRLYSLVQL
ncbi:MAG: tyrosine-type recombinase/integrase [Sporolactobacillus sp.]|jgi:integrase|nr:tyrosine-type recombinase/integrase [Sporolactobacillus sp.]